MTADQLAFLPDQPRPLTPRQAAALELVRQAGHDGIPAGEIGAHWHAHQGKHPAGRRCQYCQDEGSGVLRSKALAPLVKRRRKDGMYVLRHAEPPSAQRGGPDDQSTGADLFGF